MHNFGQQVSKSADQVTCLAVLTALATHYCRRLGAVQGPHMRKQDRHGAFIFVRKFCILLVKYLHANTVPYCCSGRIIAEYKLVGHIKTPTISLRCYIWNRRITAEQRCRENEEFASYMTEVVCRRFVTSELATRRKSFPASRA
jgi:hypothetical protein